VSELIVVAEEVREAIADERPVVALETTLVAHGFPSPEGIEVGLASAAALREVGAVPATIGVLDGRIRVGLTEDELARFTPAARKLGPRDLAACAVAGQVGATTVGGVHRGFPTPPDVSADIVTLVSSAVLVACSGAKSLLDIPATMEYLETLGVPVLGFRTETLPLFYSAMGGPPVPQRVEDAETAARVAAAHWQLGGCGLVLANPPAESLDVEELVERALGDAAAQRISGQGLTPFVLASLHEQSGGATREVNRRLIVDNARLAGEVAVAFGAL
jgi:pseudouridylate synthase